MGVQSFNDQVLKVMGRQHTRDTLFEKLDLIDQDGINNLSIDLMFANPKQTFEVWKEDVQIALSLNIQHISAYSLMLKENTAYEKWLAAGRV